MKRSGTADLPLHGGHVPPWLASRMATLGTAIAESVIHHYGRAAFLSRLSDPFWFQAFGTVMGMDWHSSGITTSVMGALKRGLNPRADELGLCRVRDRVDAAPGLRECALERESLAGRSARDQDHRSPRSHHAPVGDFRTALRLGQRRHAGYPGNPVKRRGFRVGAQRPGL